MDVTFVLLGYSSFLRTVLRLMIFHNLKSISLVDLYIYICIYIYIYTFHDKKKQTKLEAALSPLSKKLAAHFHLKIIFIELLSAKNLPST